MNLHKITQQQAIDSPQNEYNYSEWKKTVERYAQYKDVQFFRKDESEDVYVVYTIDEGLRIFKDVSYGAVLHNGGFKSVWFDMCTEDFKSLSSMITEGIKPHLFAEKFDDTKTVVTFIGFGPKRNHRAENTPQNRKLLVESNTTITTL